MIYHFKAATAKCGNLQMYNTSPIPDDTPGIGSIRANCLLVFSQSIGWFFRVKGTGHLPTGNPGLVDKVVAVNEKKHHVVGEKDSYHVDWCELYKAPPSQHSIPQEHLNFHLTSDFNDDPDFYLTTEID